MKGPSRLRWMQAAAPLARRWPRLFYRIALAGGWATWHLRPSLRGRVTRNLLPLVDGDRERAKREGIRVCQHIAQYYVDLSILPTLDLARFERENLEFVNPQYIEQLALPGPLVVVSAHTGNAELAIQAILSHGRHFAAIVEAQQPPAWAQYLLRLRSSKGGAFHQADFAGLRAAIEALKNGDVLGLMGDRDIQRTGIPVELCGRVVRLPRGPWEIARRTRALVIPVFATRKQRDHFVVHFEEPFTLRQSDDAEADVSLAASAWARLLERHLRRDPGQWVVLEDFWRVHACEREAAK